MLKTTTSGRIGVLAIVAALLAGAVVPQVFAVSASTTLAQRIESRQAEFSSQVNPDRLSQLKDHCDDAQLKLGAISTKVNDQRRRRDIAYSDLIAELHTINTKLDKQIIRHESFARELAKLDANWQGFENSTERYSAALADSRSIDCQANPEGFIVTLADARQSQISVLEKHDQFLGSLKAVKTELRYLAPLLSRVENQLLAERLKDLAV